MDISSKSVVIATHFLVYGAPQALRDYLINKKVRKLLFIAHPLFVDETKSYYEVIRKAKNISKYTFPIRFPIALINYLLEFLLSFFWLLKNQNKYDLLIGVDPLNALVGVLYKRMGKVKKFVYYTIDYVPDRFKSRVFNGMYHWLDQFCVRQADQTWNVSPKIAPAREKKGLDLKYGTKQKTVPIGIWFKKTKRVPISQVKKHQLLFVGHIMESAGVQYVLEAVPQIVQKIPAFHFLVVGGGDYLENLKKQASHLGINKHVTFTGWVKNRKKLEALMIDSALAIAPYDRRTTTTTLYSDPTKLKDYLSLGLPILLTDVPHNAYDIQNSGAGHIISLGKESINDAIIEYMSNGNKQTQARKKALSFVKQFDWETLFDNNLESLLS